MNTQDVMNEMGEALETIDGLRVYPWNVGKVTPPAAIVDLPEKVKYDETYGRGSDEATFTFLVVLGSMTERSTSKRLADYLSGSGPLSVKTAVDGFDYTSCSDVTVSEAEVMVVTFASVQYLAAQYTATALGQGG